MKKENLEAFFNSLTSLGEIWGPTKKRDKYVFRELDSFDAFDYKYTRTLLPIKKLFFKPKEQLLQFDYNNPTGGFISSVLSVAEDPPSKIIIEKYSTFGFATDYRRCYGHYKSLGS